MIGKTISHYKILEKLGEGGMGVVYKAEDTKLKRTVALKFLPPQALGSKEEKGRFVHEARAAASLNHPNICAVHEIDECEGHSFIAMEYVEGRSLKDRIEAGQLKIDEVIGLAIQIAEGMRKAHEKGIVHRDIKPANIMVTPDGQVKITDFGLAKSSSRTQLTKTGTTLGTVAYMSPEQARGEEVDHQTDIWSLGVVLYEMVAGRPPFKGDYEPAVVYSILNEKPDPPGKYVADMSEQLQLVILRCLEKDRKERYQTIEDLAFDLRGLLAEGTALKVRAADVGSLLQLLKRPRIATAAVVLIIVLAGAIFLPYQRLAKLQRAKELLPQVNNLAKAGEYFEAYQLALQIEERLADDPSLASLMPDISDKLTIMSEPEGASVFLKRFSPSDSEESSEMEHVGVTPIVDLRVARGDYRVYIEKDGYVPLERIFSSTLSRSPQRHSFMVVNIQARLFAPAEVPEDMVFVPGGNYKLVGWGLPSAPEVQLDDYFMDKYEVTNRKYQTFIEAGGYSTQRYWEFPFMKDDRELSWVEALDDFVDRSGLPGPRSWVNQEFPEGKGDYPVTGISWYEAAAYANFAGKSLPTVFQWEKAARDGAVFLGAVMPWGAQSTGESAKRRANCEGQGPKPVDSYEFGISPYGCYNMAGNVKEWCLNELSDGYATTGGSWEDPEYSFGYYGTFPGFYSSNSLGFRCVRNSPAATTDQGAMKLELRQKGSTYYPVDEETFEDLLSFYKYDAVSLEPRVTETVETSDWTRLRVTFAGMHGDRVLAYLFLPKRSAEPFQCINFISHAGVFNGVNLAASAESMFAPQIKSGRAVMAVVPKGGTEREWRPGYISPERSTVRYREQMVKYATEYSLALDYLDSRDDIDMNRLAFVGVSWGGHVGLIFAAVEHRYRSAILIGGGVDDHDLQKLPAANPINFAPYIYPPKLVLHGKYDEVNPLENYAKPLYSLLRDPKELVVVEGGHLPPLEQRVPAINRWLDETLGRVRFEGDDKP